MATILAYTSPARGHLFPIVPTLLELRRRGHEVAVRTISPHVATLRELDLDAAPLAAEIETRELDDWRARTPPGAMRRTFAGFMDRAEHEVDDLRDAIARHEPDLLLVDTNAWGASAVAEASGFPAARFHCFPWPVPDAGVPPFGPGLAPANGAIGRARDRALLPLTMRPLERFVLPRLNPVRVRAGAPPVTGLVEAYLTPLPILHLSAEPFEYPRRWPSQLHLVGPGIWDPPAAEDDELRAWLEGLDRPLAVVSTSSEFQDDHRLVDCALEGLVDELSVIATVPGGEAARRELPASARVVRFASHRLLLERAAVVVCHAGMGITQKALAHGVPVCAVPFGRDQLEVARRVEVAAAGTRLPASKLKPSRLRAAVREAIGRRDGARQVADAFAAAGGLAKAADLLEELLSQPAPLSPAPALP